jgi:DNA-directed RNA polymerase specialized sigma24 family protein
MERLDILADLKNRKNSAFSLLYKHYFPAIKRFVVSNSGTMADAQDVFQETVIVLLDKVPRKDFVLTSSIRAYVNAVASNIWLKRLRDDKKFFEVAGEQRFMEDMSFSAWQEREDHQNRRSGIRRMFRSVTRHCFIFLTKTFIVGISREKLIAELGYKNTHTFDNQKYKCLEQARKNYQPEG